METIQMESFLHQLYQMSGGDLATEVSMYVIGEHVGLDKNEAGSVAEDLIIDGFAELKTLAGGISITTKGLVKLGKSNESDSGSPDSSVYVLGSEEVLSEDDRRAVDQMLDEVKQVIFGNVQNYEELEAFVVDIKTVETQLLSPRPKTTIIKSVLLSIGEQMQECGDKHIAAKILEMTGAA